MPAAGPRLAPPWEEAATAKKEKGILLFKLFPVDRFQSIFRFFFFQGMLLIFA